VKKTLNMNKRLIASTLLLHVACACQCMAQEAGAPDIRAIVERSLPYIQAGGMEWRNDKKCVSCHTTTFTAWALNRAAETDVTVDLEAVKDWNDWSRDWINHVAVKRRDEAKRDETLLAENDSVGQLLLGRPRAAETTPEWVAEYRSFLAKAQNGDGSWKAGGQLPLQKRPTRETQEVSTMWALVALQDSGADDEVIQSALASATKWLGTKTQGKSIEWWATRLLVQRGFGNSDEADLSRKTILKHQHEDGGWGWLVEEKSDALGTGIALYALARDGAVAADAEVLRAISFLEKTQDEDGSWPVHGTKKNGADDVTDTAIYWGACWAVIALSEFAEAPTDVVQKGTAN